jgi:hypothetical protein
MVEHGEQDADADGGVLYRERGVESKGQCEKEAMQLQEVMKMSLFKDGHRSGDRKDKGRSYHHHAESSYSCDSRESGEQGGMAGYSGAGTSKGTGSGMHSGNGATDSDSEGGKLKHSTSDRTESICSCGAEHRKARSATVSPEEPIAGVPTLAAGDGGTDSVTGRKRNLKAEWLRRKLAVQQLTKAVVGSSNGDSGAKQGTTSRHRPN